MTANPAGQRVIVVVGAGRSGTSALTRGVQALGVELGDRLKAGTRKNAKGFYEDEDFIGIMYRLREMLGIKRSGAGVGIVAAERLAAPELEALVAEAVGIIRERFADYPVWGFKAGGVLGVLPFWQRVFRESGQEPSYVLALRNPLSVAQSRAKVSLRRGIQENSDLEFLGRVVPYFREAARSPLSVVDYDRLMAEPKATLERVRAELALVSDTSVEAALDTYAEEFLTGGLRHHRHDESDLDAHPRLNPLARDAYRALLRLATGEENLSSPAFWSEWARIEQTHAAMAPALRHIDALEGELRRYRQGLGGAFVLGSQLWRKWRG